jgi:hypothetical protein
MVIELNPNWLRISKTEIAPLQLSRLSITIKVNLFYEEKNAKSLALNFFLAGVQP